MITPYTFFISEKIQAEKENPYPVSKCFGIGDVRCLIPLNQDFNIKKIDSGVFFRSLDVIECGTQAFYNGGQSYPNEQQVLLGSALGNVTLNYNALSVPDWWLVIDEANNVVKINTGYRGDAKYDFGGSSRLAFNGSLAGKQDPLYNTTYPDFTNYPDDGYPRVNSPGSGSQIGVKTDIDPVWTVRVYAPMSSTAWNYTLSCPDGIVPVDSFCPTWQLDRYSINVTPVSKTNSILKSGAMNIINQSSESVISQADPVIQLTDKKGFMDLSGCFEMGGVQLDSFTVQISDLINNKINNGELLIYLTLWVEMP